ncbi:hypothetical protein PG987_015032 [Apiospora arundinis]
MRVQRAVHRYAVWPESEKELLRKAEEEYENRRLSEILKIFLDLGGGQNWKIKLPHIAKQLIEMGVDAFDPEFDPKKARRRRKMSSRRRSCTTNALHDPTSMNQYLGESLLYDEDHSMGGLDHHNAVRLNEEDDERLFAHYLKEESPSPEPDSSLQDISAKSGGLSAIEPRDYHGPIPKRTGRTPGLRADDPSKQHVHDPYPTAPSYALETRDSLCFPSIPAHTGV